MNRLKNSFRKQNAYRIAYISIGVLFLFWILFLDSHSWLTHQELNTEIETLQQRKKNLQKSIAKDQKAIEQLNNLDSLEKYAREQYGHKKEGETIFIIEK
ncbi:septum formation initiator family protein [Flavobacteriaceae bacterium]|nr:septum formation initiator family protein [Flavobacteriaceae bacterium]MDA9183962.1 septum formation initiator family protein [Flavobacteriaceae bacterium]MDA9245118.1 septum formation initiator family protein [Flavobacteriaceae bacterium]MDB2673122.1 septum formation initiator family protein [Flavobacteriaceae bacterium]MDB4113260.1 septum formation initiator family protein [Flavobacteriaceae bacterium]